MWRGPPLDLVEGPLEGTRSALFSVLKADAVTHAHLQRPLVDPARRLHRGADQVAPGVRSDRLLHRVPGDVEPVQWMRVHDVDGAHRRSPLGYGRRLSGRLSHVNPPHEL